ncbi:telomere binding protein [Pleosporales sp. CAS-2024a]
MADFLTAVSTKKIKTSENLVQDVGSLSIRDAVLVDSAQTALDALRGQPSQETVENSLKYMTSNGFSLLLPETLNASIAYQLVNDTIPHYWKPLRTTPLRKLFAKSLRNPTGLGHILTRLRTLIVDSQQNKSPVEAQNQADNIGDLIDVLEAILRGNETSGLVLFEIHAHSKSEMQQKALWREYITQTASGRIVSIVAEAEDVLKKKGMLGSASWLADGNAFADWLGSNIAFCIREVDGSDKLMLATADLCSRALALGYTGQYIRYPQPDFVDKSDRVVSALTSSLLTPEYAKLLSDLIRRMKPHEQRKYLDAIIAYIAKQLLHPGNENRHFSSITPSLQISGVAALLHTLVKGNEGLTDHLVSNLTRSTIPSLDESLSARRSVMATLAQDQDKLHTLLENSIKMFGDPIYIKHVPVLQQEALAQNLVLCAGYVYRTQPMFLSMMAKSSYHINGMSNRIGATSLRARFLGIATGVAISKMVDKPDLQLKFELEGPDADEAAWYERLTEVEDKVGTISDIKDVTKSRSARVKSNVSGKTTKGEMPGKPAITELQGPRVVEVLSDTEDEDDDLMVYGKPDSDPEDDDDEDPTVITRNKPTAPVYIRDLIAGLRDQDNYDRHKLALSTAASLIRRKANFGTEVTDHLEELATILSGLQDNLELEGFAQRRQQAMIAVLLAKPAQMAQWFARSFFSGDYSLIQRIVMLTTLGLGARELAGIKDSSVDDDTPPPMASSFPSKQLPPHLDQLYAENKDQNQVAKISTRIARQMLSPLAAQAADQLSSGPTILKVRTFSSRLQVEQKRPKPTPNALSQLVADNFFFPLTARWWLHVRATTTTDSLYASRHLLPHFLHTLSLLLHAAGPHTPSLPQMSREYWDLLLSVRGLAQQDKQVLYALLFAFLMLLQTNENKERVATEQGKELLETQAWVKMVFEGLGAGSDEDEQVRVLAAGVLVRCQEVVEQYQRRMAGVLIDYY